MNNEIIIRKAEEKDEKAIWEIITQVISKGDTYVFAPNSSKEKMLLYWFGKDRHTYVATQGNKVVGTFVIKDNQQDLGSHVANGSYMTKPSEFGKGIGRAMGEHSLIEAKRLGYKSMQFNIVIKTNERAVALWKKLGFKVIGESPDAFNHIKHGLTNALIMWRKL